MSKETETIVPVGQPRIVRFLRWIIGRRAVAPDWKRRGRVPLVRPGVWIKNVSEGYIRKNGMAADCDGADGAICGECGKRMPRIWDTVCSKCGATSCYAHSYTDGDLWFCKSCKPNAKGNAPGAIEKP